jgi:hypothetical protein
MVHEVGQRQSAVRVCACWVEDSVLAHVKQQQQQEQEKGSRKTTTATVWKQSQFLFVLQFAHSGFLFARMLATKWLKHTTRKQGHMGKWEGSNAG